MQALATSEKSKSTSTVAIHKNKHQQFFAPVKIQPKLTIGPVDDPYEREADSVADHVMRMPVQQNATPYLTYNKPSFFSPKPITTLNVQCECASYEKEKLKRKEEKPEEENNVKRRKEKSYDGGLNNIENVVQRKCAHCEEEEKEKVQMKREAGTVGGTTAPSIVQDVINSSGQPLDEGTKKFMESRFGYDFKNVQVHDDAAAHQSSAEINALAYTHKNHVVFGAGQYKPGTNSVKQLLAHELVHVVQQGNLQKQSKPAIASAMKEVQNNSAILPSIQRTCGKSGIIAKTPPGCATGDHSFIPGTLFKFKKGCDEFAPGQETAIRSFASSLSPSATIAIHSYSSTDGASYNEQLSCARSAAVYDFLTTPAPGGVGIAASRITLIINHGPTPGPQDDRRSVALITSTPAHAPAPAPTPTPAAPPILHCGPNVSSQVRDAVTKVKTTWASWNSSQKDNACDALDSTSTKNTSPAGTMLAAVSWDINDLHDSTWIPGYQPACATAGGCEQSVEVDGNCYYRGSANYVIFGTMCKLCDAYLGWEWHTPRLGWLNGFPEWYMQYLITLYKGGALPRQTQSPNYGPSLLWATAGFHGWPSGGTPPAGDRSRCLPGCPTVYRGTAFTVHWHPNGTF